ncbi:MAG: DNA primase [Myxococcaceae bacterium]
MLIPDSKIQEVRERVDMIALVQRHGVELKKSGRSYKGLCPFHGEKSPSFYVWPDEKRFKCFGCQAGGDAISFVQRLMGKTFVDTVRDLAKELGIDLESAVDPAMREKQQVKDATDFAAQHFVERLWDPVVGRHARDYLHGRGLTDDLIRAFGLGWAPLQWTELADKFRERGLLAFGEKAGLVAPRQRGDGFYDMFRGRVIIPIRSPEGRTIAFGGRLLEGDDGPKYLNSRENRLYNKSEILYATDQARDEIRKKKSAVLCEGYFDAIGMHQAGVKNAVALCSTALTPGHLTLLGRLEAKELVLLLDGDEAGRKAVERLAGALLAGGVNCKVAVLPDGEDPDTFARKAGVEGVAKLLAEARPLTAHLFESLLPRGKDAEFEEKMAALDRFKPIAAAVPVGLTRSALFGAMSKHFALPAAELETALKSKAAPVVRPVPKPKSNEPPPDQNEATWVAAILKDRRLFDADQAELKVAYELKHMGLRTLVAAIQSGTAAEEALYEASDVVKTALTKARDLLPADEDALRKGFEAVSARLKLRAVEDRLQIIAREIANAPGGTTELTQESRDLLTEQGALMLLKQKLKSQK